MMMLRILDSAQVLFVKTLENYSNLALVYELKIGSTDEYGVLLQNIINLKHR